MSMSAPPSVGQPTRNQIMLAKVVWVSMILFVLAGVAWYGLSGEVLMRVWHNLIERSTATRLSIWYELSDYTLKGLETVLARQGVHLDNSMHCRILRGIIAYSEETQMRNMRVPERLIKKSHDVYSKAWEHHPHGDHDETPPELRQER